MGKSYRCEKCNSAPHHCDCYRVEVEKCPHHNPQGQCPQCNLAKSWGYQSTSQAESEEKGSTDILFQVREFLNQTKEPENCSITKPPVIENPTSSEAIAETIRKEKPDWPGWIWGMVFLLLGISFFTRFFRAMKEKK